MSILRKRTDNDFYIGLLLAITSTVFIGTSFIIKKIGLLRHSGRGTLRAGAGGFGYLKEWIWWLGLITMGFGELANFAAYALAPATLVTPLGALSILVSAVLSSKCLNEKLNILGKLGCILCIIGSTMTVIHSPHEESMSSINEFLEKVQSSSFQLYLALVVFTGFAIAFHFGPKYGDQYVAVYLVLCGSIGSLTVMSCKGLGMALKGPTLDWSAYVFFIALCTCVVVQMNFLNKSLDIFNTNIVTTVYYVLFTSFVILASSIVFNEWADLRAEDIVGNVSGFCTIIVGIFMLNVFKDVEINAAKIFKTKPNRQINGYQAAIDCLMGFYTKMQENMKILLKVTKGEQRLTKSLL